MQFHDVICTWVENLFLPVWSASILVEGNFELSNIHCNSNTTVITFFFLLFPVTSFLGLNFQIEKHYFSYNEFLLGSTVFFKTICLEHITFHQSKKMNFNFPILY